MKKLLSILTITTLTASVPAPLLANTPLTRTKRDVSTLSSNSNNDYLQLKEIIGIGKGIFYTALDSKDNIYFVTSDKLYVLKQGSTTPTKINGINDNMYSLAVDSKDNIYYIKPNREGTFVLKHGETTPTKVDGISSVISLAVDKNDNIYLGSVFYNFSILQTALSWVKQQSQFALVDSTKKRQLGLALTCLALMGS